MKEEKEYRCPCCGWISDLQDKEPWPDHCPNCLSGIHSADEEGEPCGGILEPVGWDLGERKRCLGDRGEMPVLRRDDHCGDVGERQSHKSDVHCLQTFVLTTFSP